MEVAADGAQAKYIRDKNGYASVLQVFQDFVQYFIQTSKSVDIICRHWAPSRKITNHWVRRTVSLPSWIQSIEDVPSGLWDQTVGRIAMTSLVGTPTQQWYNASRDTRGYAVFQDVLVKRPRRHS